MLADGSGHFTRAAKMELDLTDKGLGVRSQRYAMVVDNGNHHPPDGRGRAAEGRKIKCGIGARRPLKAWTSKIVRGEKARFDIPTKPSLRSFRPSDRRIKSLDRIVEIKERPEGPWAKKSDPEAPSA